jgi:lysophospholipase L1-like esterase
MSLALKILLVLGVILVAFIAYQAIRTRHFIRIGVGLAQAAVPFERRLPGAETRILVIGDSSAVGTGAADPAQSIAGRLGADYPAAEILNEGFNGRKTAELVPRLQELAAAGEHYDLMVIQIGGNDIVRFTPYDEAAASLDQALQLATTMADQVVLLHGGNVGTAKLLPLGTRWIFTQRTKRVRENWLATADRYPTVHYVDIFRRAQHDPFATDPEKFYAADQFHPSGDGYGDWYRFVQQTMVEANSALPR